jgi:hypothetical protein
MNIPENLFELTDEQIETSKMMYNGKVIKCLVAPYHSYSHLETVVPFTTTTYLFPEREMTYAQTLKFISMVVNSATTEEIRIITTHMNIITDMVGGCVRVLTEKDEVVDTDSKTFAANIHDVKFNLLEDESHQLSKAEHSEAIKSINELVEKLKVGSMTDKEYTEAKAQIDMIGEIIIRNPLNDMLADVKRI